MVGAILLIEFLLLSKVPFYAYMFVVPIFSGTYFIIGLLVSTVANK
jgi:hypothetical protein